MHAGELSSTRWVQKQSAPGPPGQLTVVPRQVVAFDEVQTEHLVPVQVPPAGHVVQLPLQSV
jgi:hypothetical protein